MLSTTTGWGVANFTVVRTIDGGKSWYSTDEPKIPQLRVFAGEFLDARHAWVVVRDAAPANPNVNPLRVDRTVDGGRTWQPASAPLSTVGTDEEVDAPDFVNTQDGWIEIVTNGGPGRGYESVDIFRTTDGGQVWKKVANTDGPSGLTSQGIKSGISFKDAQNGWATATSGKSTPWLYVTRNGGVNWQSQTLPGVKGNKAYQTTPPIFFGNQGLLPVSSSSDSVETAFYTTKNGGQTWNAPQKAVPSFSIHSIQAIDTNHAWAINDRDLQLYATNSKNWQQWHLVSGNAVQYGIMRLDFVNASDGWAVSNNQGKADLIYTTDGGHTWKQE